MLYAVGMQRVSGGMAEKRVGGTHPIRNRLRLGLLVLALVGVPQISLGQVNRGETRSAVGDVTSLPDSMLIYAARGVEGACGSNCTAWIAAEGTVHWDSYKRMIAALDRLAGQKVPVLVDVRGRSDLRSAISVGRILRERGLEVFVGRTIVEKCRGIGETDCVTLKRSGGPLQASIAALGNCDIACLLILAGGVKRSVPEDTAVVIGGTQVGHRLGLGVPDEVREGVHGRSAEQIKLYLTQMGVDPALADMIDANYAKPMQTTLTRVELVRLKVVTP